MSEILLKVMTLNIWCYSPPWDVRKRLIAEEIRRHSPDMVGLQEVVSDPQFDEDGKNQAVQIAELLPGYEAVSSLRTVPGAGRPIKAGLAILSRLPMVETNDMDLTYSVELNPHPRVVLGARIKVSGKELYFVVTHLSTHAPDRLVEAKELAHFIERYSSGLPVVVVGDFNEEPHEPVILFMKGLNEIDGTKLKFKDAWEEVRPDEEGFTYKTPDPYMRIDYIFVTPSIEVLECQLVCNEPDANGVYPSDHLGVLATILIT